MKANEFNMNRILALFMVINLWGCCGQWKYRGYNELF